MSRDAPKGAQRLTELPESLGQLTQLQRLDLSRNQLTELPQWLGRLTQLQELDVSHNQLTQLPQGIDQLAHLQMISLSNNRLQQLPDFFGKLAALRYLYVYDNELMALPNSLSQLTKLEDLHLGGNILTTLPSSLMYLHELTTLVLNGNKLPVLPEWIGQLSRLEHLAIGGMNLQVLPDSLRNLSRIKNLYIWGNPLTRVPDWVYDLTTLETLNMNSIEISELPEEIGHLRSLKSLLLEGNGLNELPISLTQLEHLDTLELNKNPLNPELAAAYKEGLKAVKRYLTELAKGVRRRFEAKLLILGDGNEGKTCISRAIRGLPFLPQVTTRGVDVEQWQFENPKHTVYDEKNITLNIWDFEGQEINHQTHQFFLTSQSLYILVFKCRDQFFMDRAEYWLDTIRARAPKAKAAIVISQSEERTPYVPQDKLQAQYGDLLAKGKWLFAVGCADNSGVEELRGYLKRWAADLEFMGRAWPDSYSRAEVAIKDRAKMGEAHINRSQLYDIFKNCGIDGSIFKDLSASMATLGVITQFPDCPDLLDFVVLQPQWLTKAISEIMEDKQLTLDKGEISLERMQIVWEDKGYAGMFATFHNCMKEFELCYDLEDASRSCLVPLRFGYEKPQIPWSSGNDLKERRVEYKLNIRPPMGLMSRFIVKTHHMMVSTFEYPKGVYWHNGVFLRTGTGPLISEALCEFDNDGRKLLVQVRAAFPQNLLEQIHAYVKAVFAFFSGLEPERAYGCMKIDYQTKGEKKCKGMHSESRIYSAIRKQRVLDCEYEFHDVDPQKLIWGFSSFGQYVLAKVASIEELRQELDKKPSWAENLTRDMGTLIDWVERNRQKMDQLLMAQANLLPAIKQEAELKLHEYLGYINQMLDDRELTSAPGILSIETKDRSKWNPQSYFTKTYILTPFCECDQNIHPCEDGRAEFTKDREWWAKTAPWIARGTKVLSVGLQLAFAGMPLALGDEVFKGIKNDVKFMNELAKNIELKEDSSEKEVPRDFAETMEEGLVRDLRLDDRETRLMKAALARFLEAVAPDNYRARQWGSLRRVRMTDNSYRWLCESCAKERRS